MVLITYLAPKCTLGMRETNCLEAGSRVLELGGCNHKRLLKHNFRWETLRRFCYRFNRSLACNVARMPPFLMYFNGNLGYN
jgi:hypothetical protein